MRFVDIRFFNTDSSIVAATALKNLFSLLLSYISDFYMIDTLLIAVYAYP